MKNILLRKILPLAICGSRHRLCDLRVQLKFKQFQESLKKHIPCIYLQVWNSLRSNLSNFSVWDAMEIETKD